ncbi:MAG: hypothetical protein AB1916_01390 [Thermodesulfobacteriota bacterium]
MDRAIRVCVCGFSMYHIPLAARAVAEICPELAPRLSADLPEPQGLANAFPEIPALRLLATSGQGCRLIQPFGGPEQPVEDLERTLAEHPLLLFYDAVQSFTPAVLERFDRVIYLHRGVCDLYAADTLARFHLLGKDAQRGERDHFLRANAVKAAQFWNFQTLGFRCLAQRLPVHFLDFDALAADRARVLSGLATFLGRPAPAPSSVARLLDRTGLPPEFAKPGLGELILPRDVRDTLVRYCGDGTDSPGMETALSWDQRNSLHFLSGRSRTDHVVVHIPARSGSTRLPGKNIADLGGKPLMAWTILLARRVPGVHRVIVNTDDPEYAAIAREYGAETPFLRPKNISGEMAAISDATEYLAHYLEQDADLYAQIAAMPRRHGSCKDTTCRHSGADC